MVSDLSPLNGAGTIPSSWSPQISLVMALNSLQSLLEWKGLSSRSPFGPAGGPGGGAGGSPPALFLSDALGVSLSSGILLLKEKCVPLYIVSSLGLKWTLARELGHSSAGGPEPSMMTSEVIPTRGV
jgi:hypothetical protein